VSEKKSVGEMQAFPTPHGGRPFDAGMTYRQWLIGMIASGQGIDRPDAGSAEANQAIRVAAAHFLAQMATCRADAIIKHLDEEKR
jgi:hypothetical protein